MGRCKNCPIWAAIESGNEFVDEFEDSAIDDERKPGHDILKRNRVFKKVFQIIEPRINCNYDNQSEEEVEMGADQLQIELVAEEPSEIDLDRAVVEETDHDPETVPIPIQAPSNEALAQLVAAINAAQNAPKKACTELFNETLSAVSLNNGTIMVFPDGHAQHENIRKKRPQDRGSGQYL